MVRLKEERVTVGLHKFYGSGIRGLSEFSLDAFLLSLRYKTLHSQSSGDRR